MGGWADVEGMEEAEKGERRTMTTQMRGRGRGRGRKWPSDETPKYLRCEVWSRRGTDVC